jgi:hypothetical protein
VLNAEWPARRGQSEYRVLDASRWPSEASYDGTRATAEPLRASLASQIFARMSGMLDLSRDEKAKHRLPRKFSEAPTCLRHADEPLHLLERIVDLAVEEDLLRREVAAVHRLEDRVEAFLVAGLVGDLATLDGVEPRQHRRHRYERPAHGDENLHDADAHQNGGPAFQDRREHGDSLFGESIRRAPEPHPQSGLFLRRQIGGHNL